MTASGPAPGRGRPCILNEGGIEIADRVVLHSHLHRERPGPSRPVDIGDRAGLCDRAIVLPGVRIGEGAVIGAGAVVTRDVPAWTLAAGNPARVIRSLA